MADKSKKMEEDKKVVGDKKSTVKLNPFAKSSASKTSTNIGLKKSTNPIELDTKATDQKSGAKYKSVVKPLGLKSKPSSATMSSTISKSVSPTKKPSSATMSSTISKSVSPTKKPSSATLSSTISKSVSPTKPTVGSAIESKLSTAVSEVSVKGEPAYSISSLKTSLFSKSDIDIFKPLEMPEDILKNPPRPSWLRSEASERRSRYSDPQPSSSKTEMSEDVRDYYKTLGAVPKTPLPKKKVFSVAPNKGQGLTTESKLPYSEKWTKSEVRQGRTPKSSEMRPQSAILPRRRLSLDESPKRARSPKGESLKTSKEAASRRTNIYDKQVIPTLEASKTLVRKSSKLISKPSKGKSSAGKASSSLKSAKEELKRLTDISEESQVDFASYETKESVSNSSGPESAEISSPKHRSNTVKKSSKITSKSPHSEAIYEGATLDLGNFKEDLGEAILDSIFFGTAYDDDDFEKLEEDKDDLDFEKLEEDKDDLDFEPCFDNYEDNDLNENVRKVISPIALPQVTRVIKGGGADSPDLEFVYDDTDTHGNEIAELYSYTEQPELQLNVRAFEDQMESYKLPPSWQRLSVEKRKSVVMKLLDQLEVSRKSLRMRSARCILYIAQGCWAEMQSDTEQQHWARINCMLLYQLGAFSAFTDLLNIEIENSTAAHVAMRKIAVSLADSQDLRVILSVLYSLAEVIRNESATDNGEYKKEIEAFCFEIGNASGDDLLVIKLLGMVTRFCSGAAPHFPMKKVLLLLWKLILVSLGGMTTLKELKAEKRKRANLTPQDEDTMEIAKTMRSSSPPASASDLLEAQNQKRNTRPFRRSLMKQSSLDDQESLGMEMETTMGNDNGDDLADMTEYDERRPSENSDASQMYNNHNINMYNRQMSPPPPHDILPRGLPWKPKVRQKDIDMFLDGARQKFLGYSLPGDQETLFGLPEPIHEGVKILKEHVYTSLAELQIQKEEEIARNPLSTVEDEIDLTPAEILYQAMLPNLPQYMIALLKILLAAAPTSKAKTDSINIMADVLPEEMPMTVLQSMKLGIDVNRHKEIIVKAVSAVLLLLLKHFKLNHIYQFEFMSQHLVFANCIPLVLKFFNQNIMAYVGAKNVIPILDFPSCVIGDQPELTAESLEIGDAASFSWRNMFSCINLLRILNKLTKWKHSRIMMLVVFKSAPILKRTLKVRHAMTQLYVLKLLKMQTKYLGRQWRKSNMKTISAIYQKVRHRLNDDWAYGNDLDARPWDFQAEECALRASVDRFNNRRYTLVNESDFEPVDNCLSSVLGANHDISDSFKNHYHLWLEQEVFGIPIEWEKLLLNEEKQ